MGLQRLTERRSEQIAGVLFCYDRPLIQGTLPGLCYAEGMTAYLYTHHVRIFDDAQWAQPLREAPRENAERLAQENGLQIEFIRRPKSFRKEDKIHQVLKEWGDYPGPVWIFSPMEPCSTYQPWHNKQTGQPVEFRFWPFRRAIAMALFPLRTRSPMPPDAWGKSRCTYAQDPT